MDKEKFAALWAYITNQEETINYIFQKINQLEPLNEDKLVNLAYHLHNLYSAYEDMFKEISICFENSIERSSGYHKNLLLRMKFAIPGIRQQVLSKLSYEVLSELLGFRHVFRHAYNYNLSPDKLQLLRDKILNHRENLNLDIADFKNFLASHFNE